MTFFILWGLAGLAVGIVFASFFEWTLHKYVMHRPVGKFRYAFQAHAIVHHGTFKADKTYHLHDEKDKETIPMAWWNGPVLILIGAIPFAILSWLTGQWAFVVGGALAFAMNGSLRVLFTDVDMPGSIDGLELARIAHALWPKLRILVTSGKNAPRALPEHGRFVGKPYVHEQIVRDIGRLLAA